MKLDKLSCMTIDPPRTRRVGFEEDETAGTRRDANWHGLTLCSLKISTDVSWYTRCMAHSYGGFKAVGIPLIGTLMQHAAAYLLSSPVLLFTGLWGHFYKGLPFSYGRWSSCGSC